jgi:hypothetical protein
VFRSNRYFASPSVNPVHIRNTNFNVGIEVDEYGAVGRMRIGRGNRRI